MAIPPFRLTDTDLARLAEVEAMCRSYGMSPKASIELELLNMHRAHAWANRQIVGVYRSLDGYGFNEAWNASRTENMSEALAEGERVCGGERRLAA